MPVQRCTGAVVRIYGGSATVVTLVLSQIQWRFESSPTSFVQTRRYGVPSARSGDRKSVVRRTRKPATQQWGPTSTNVFSGHSHGDRGVIGSTLVCDTSGTGSYPVDHPTSRCAAEGSFRSNRRRGSPMGHDWQCAFGVWFSAHLAVCPIG